MATSSSSVLKNNQIRMTEPGRPGAPAAPRPAHDRSEIRTVERNANDAVVEIRCVCGRHTYMHLRWPQPGAPADPAADGPRKTVQQ
ncbi:MAG: hypothetical protein NT049_02005 [Planctomycetota bacterium]|nr:hypothetical protein [Planctomycetota bacterium]